MILYLQETQNEINKYFTEVGKIFGGEQIANIKLPQAATVTQSLIK